MPAESTITQRWLICTAIAVIIIIYLLKSEDNTEGYSGTFKRPNITSMLPLWDQTLEFNHLNFSNETGNPTGGYIVPNYIHFIRLGGKSINYVELICILAALKNQKPDKVFFHYDDKTTFTGKYWKILDGIQRFRDIVVFHKVALPDNIFGQPLRIEMKRWLGSDILRIQMVMKYGGVFLENDCYLVKSVNDYRRFEISINWDVDQFLSNSVIIAHKDARFLRKWLECYKVYDKSQLYNRGGERPTVEILYKNPELIHRVKVLFGLDFLFMSKLYGQQWNGWHYLYIVHLYIQYHGAMRTSNEKPKYPVEFNESNIAQYNITFREMAYDVYDVASIKWQKIK